MNRKHTRNGIIFGIILSAMLVFVAELLFGSEASFSVLLVAPVLMTLFLPGRNIAIITAVICTALTLVTFLLAGFSHTAIINLSISVIGIWSAFFFILKFKSHADDEGKTKERLNALFEFATEGMIIADSKGEIVMINPMAERQFGYESGELNRKKIENLIPDRLSDRHVKHREKYEQHPYPRPMGKGTLLHGKRKDGSEFPVEISLSNFSAGNIHYVIAFIIDISERRKSEEQIQKEKELAQRYLDIAPVIFLVLDVNENVILINQNGCHILGCAESEIVGRNWFSNYVTGDAKESSRQLFHQLISARIHSNTPFENEIITAHGEKRLISWKNTIIRDERGNPLSVLSAGEDITKRKHHEALIENASRELKRYSDEILQLNADLEKRVQVRTEELEKINSELAVEVKERKQAESQLEQNREELRVALNKEKELSELKSRFVTMASHEFRTPLSTILTSVSLIAKYNDPDQLEKRHRHVERIKSSVYNLTSILNDFLSLGKLEEGKVSSTPSEFEITAFADELTAELKEVTKTGQSIRYTHSGENTRVVLDKNLTRNICINLLSNAIKYSDERTEINFTTTIRNGNLEISVTDHGIGIPETEQQHVFERFFRANNAVNIQGTGLGLNIVKKYVELMQGIVTFKSKSGEGTTFTVKLPVG